MKKNTKKYAGMKIRLFRKIQPFLEQYGIENETIVDAIERAFEEMNRCDGSIQPWLLSLVFRKIFEDKGILLINLRTPAGNKVSLDVLTAAHAMWLVAQRAADKRGMDELDAAQAMIHIVYVVADRLAQGAGAPIRNIRKFIFKGYMNELKRIARKAGIVYQPAGETRSVSDDGAFIAALEDAMLCDELFGKLSPRLETAASLRYKWGYNCEETAAILGLSNSAARQALSRGFREMFELNMQELRALGYEEIIPKREKR